ncbi:MAG TPA: methionyl-tRNA formyltransferase [candidate division Zixibacteria bacterium]|nr:methionyl-tRNA formyltransferase [candidate division Zixibacteria bacterium]
MSNDLLRVVFFSEEGSDFGKRHFAALLDLPEVEIAAVVVSPLSHTGEQNLPPGITLRDRIRNAAWRCLHAVAGLSPKVDPAAFYMEAEVWIRGIPFLRPRRIKKRSFIQTIRELAPDVILCAGHRQIFPESLIQIPKLTAINFHPSLLPECRGRNPWFWTIVTGQQQTGVTAHHMTLGIDEGDIIIQEKVPLTGKETYMELYARLTGLSADMVPNVVALCRTGDLPSIPQRPGGSRFSDPSAADYRIDWTKPAIEIERGIRACMGQRGAITTLKGDRIYLCKADMADETGPVGQILTINERGVLAGTKDASLWIRRIRQNDQDLPANEVADDCNWQIGDRFA